jgi:DNA-directed RNA polymerase subunit RPC12/RpoP
MQFSEILCAFINQAREEIEPNAEWEKLYPYELAILRRLVPAIDSQSDAQLLGTALQMKAELDARTTPVFTILRDVVDMLVDELQGKPSYTTLRCSRCGAAIPILHQDIRFGASYACTACGNNAVLPPDLVQ